MSDKYEGFWEGGEAKTLEGDIVQFTCKEGFRKQVRGIIEASVGEIDTAQTACTEISHGGLGRYSRYKLIQRMYTLVMYDDIAIGFTEILEIKNPPDNRKGVVIYRQAGDVGYGGERFFVEWDTVKNAKKAMDIMMSTQLTQHDDQRFWSRLPGFKRFVNCQEVLTPWFYAVGTQCLVGDFVFPEGMNDDPVFSVGKRFIVIGKEGFSVKTCVGARFITEELRKDKYAVHNGGKTEIRENFRIVYWHDGTVWDELKDVNNPPTPIREDKLWIIEAMNKFNKLLNGDTEEFTIDFVGGHKFKGELIKDRHCNTFSNAPGNYLAVVYIKGHIGTHKGWSGDFVPTEQYPTILEFIKGKFKALGKDVERIEFLEMKDKDGKVKKWKGVYY